LSGAAAARSIGPSDASRLANRPDDAPGAPSADEWLLAWAAASRQDPANEQAGPAGGAALSGETEEEWDRLVDLLAEDWAAEMPAYFFD